MRFLICFSTLAAFAKGMDTIDACRRDPTWSESVEYDGCKTLMGWKPRDSLWTKMAPEVEEKDTAIRECLRRSLDNAKHQHAWARCDEDPNQKECTIRSSQVRGHYHRGDADDSDEIVVLSDVFSEQEAYAMEALDSCIRHHFKGDDRFYKAREFGNETAPSYGMYNDDGGNYCTFLNGLLQIYLPGVAAAAFRAVQQAYDHSMWGPKRNLPPPNELGVHSAEFLQYRSNGKLSLHVDDESIYTISVALSRFGDYEGGYFRLATKEALFKVPRRSAIVFFGESYHGVTEIDRGERKVFVMELWNEADAPIGSSRPEKVDYLDFQSTSNEAISHIEVSPKME